MFKDEPDEEDVLALLKQYPNKDWEECYGMAQILKTLKSDPERFEPADPNDLLGAWRLKLPKTS